MFEFKRFPMLDADDGLNIGGTGAEEPEVAEPVKNDSDTAFAELRRRAEEAERLAN